MIPFLYRAFQVGGDLLPRRNEIMADEGKSGGIGSLLGRIAASLLFLTMAYLAVHLYFMWQPVGSSSPFAQAVKSAKLGSMKFFPAIEDYDLNDIDARKGVLAGKKYPKSPLPARLASAIERDEPVEFTEAEVNVWLRNRLQVEQGGLLGDWVKVKGVWVHFTPDEIEVIIERELPQWKATHVVSLYMQFESIKNGFLIHRYAAHVGQVKVPSGFARLVMPSFNHMAEALAEELKLYKDDSLSSDKALKIHSVRVEEGKITLDPRLPSSYKE